MRAIAGNKKLFSLTSTMVHSADNIVYKRELRSKTSLQEFRREVRALNVLGLLDGTCLRGSKILKRPKASTTTYGLKSWRFMAPKLWNSLPDSSRTVRTFKAFKNSIKILDLTGLL